MQALRFLPQGADRGTSSLPNLRGSASTPFGDLRDSMFRAVRSPGTVVVAPRRCLGNVALWPVAPDGQCCWNALVISMAVQAGHTVARVREACGPSTVRRLARDLRLQVASELKDTSTGGLKQEYVPFWAAGEEGTEGVQDDVAYVTALEQGRIFAGQLEVHVAAKVLSRVIVVLNIVARHVRITAFAPTRAPLRQEEAPLLLVRRGLHFDTCFFRSPPLSKSRSVSPDRLTTAGRRRLLF